MIRTTTVPAIQISESITSVTHYPNNGIEFYVGTGKDVNGEFIFDVPQQFQVYRIKEDKSDLTPCNDYSEFIATYGINFYITDLWNYVDKVRSIA